MVGQNLSFLTAPDFEVPTDSNKDGIYAVTVTATDAGGLSVSKNILVTVADVAEAQSFTLTAAANTFTGGVGNDTFDATTSNSLDSNDVLSGGAGSDTLTANLNGAGIRPTITDIETIVVTNVTAVSTLNLGSTTNATTLTNRNSTANLVVTNAPSSIATLNIQAAVADTSNTEITYATGALTGTTDALTVSLDGTTNQKLVLTRAGTEVLETVSINSNVLASSLASVDTGSAAVSTVNLGGSQNLTVTALNGGTTLTAIGISGAGNKTATSTKTIPGAPTGTATGRYNARWTTALKIMAVFAGPCLE